MTQTQSHTPGEWLQNHIDIYPEHGDKICTVFKSEHRTPEENQANAYLIVAAPELLANLEQLCELLESIGHDVTPARQAILRAKGGAA